MNDHELSSGELINEEEFFQALDQIFTIYQKSNLIPAPAVHSLIDYVKQNIGPLGLFFTGRAFCKGLAAFVKASACEAAWKSVVQGYFAKASDSLLMFDEIERQVVKSSAAGGAWLINVEQEVWFF